VTTRLPGLTACTTNLCLNGGLCTSVPGGGFQCSCPSGYVGTRCDFYTGIFHRSILKPISSTSQEYPVQLVHLVQLLVVLIHVSMVDHVNRSLVVVSDVVALLAL
jgi:hypothetical protein